MEENEAVLKYKDYLETERNYSQYTVLNYIKSIVSISVNVKGHST